jgi:hypothetical protein
MHQYIEAADLAARFPSTRPLAQHISDQIRDDPGSEPYWLALAQACEDILSATRQ